MPSAILIHAAVWPQQTWAENWGVHNVARAEVYQHAKFHLDPYNRLGTIHKRHRQTDRQDRTGQDRHDRQTMV